VRALSVLSLLCVVALIASCDRNSNVGDGKDALVDIRPDSALPREASADSRRPDGTARVGWAVSAGGPGGDSGWELVIDGSDNIIVAGSMGQTAEFGNITIASARSDGLFVAKLDKSGKFLWAVPLEGRPNSVHDIWNGIAVDNAGNIFYVGAFTATAHFGSATFVSKGG
jgi:hypothetical protein